MVLWRNEKFIPKIIPKLILSPLLVWSNDVTVWEDESNFDNVKFCILHYNNIDM